MTRRVIAPPRSIEVSGNRGGSFVHIEDAGGGMIHLAVGETCVSTVDQKISVAALAAVLTWCRDEGFQKIVDQYVGRGGGVPEISVDHDL